MARSVELEANAERLRGRLAAQIVDVRERLRLSNVLAAAQEELTEAAAPVVNRVGDAAKTYAGAFSLIGAAVGLASLPRKKASSALSSIREAQEPPLPRARTLTLVGAGAVLGALVSTAIPSAPGERRLLRAARKDIGDVFARESTRHINSLLSSESQRANVIKLGLAALAVLAQAKPKKTTSAGA